MLIAGDDNISMTALPLTSVFQCLLTFALVSASHLVAEIWQLSRQGATGEFLDGIQIPET